jgi:hypothetical protein
MKHKPMEKRSHARVSIRRKIMFLSDTSKRFGTLADCSESGMFIKTMSSFPFESEYDILIPRKEDVLIIPVKVVRAVTSENFYEGMGVQLVNTPTTYLNFVMGHHRA